MGALARVVIGMDRGIFGGYSTLIFTGWDHGIKGDRAIKMKQNNLRYQLQVSREKDEPDVLIILYNNSILFLSVAGGFRGGTD